MATPGIEIDAGRCRDTGFLEHARAEFLAVVGEGRNVGIHIESAVRGRIPNKRAAKFLLQQILR